MLSASDHHHHHLLIITIIMIIIMIMIMAVIIIIVSHLDVHLTLLFHLHASSHSNPAVQQIIAARRW